MLRQTGWPFIDPLRIAETTIIMIIIITIMIIIMIFIMIINIVIIKFEKAIIFH